jgi:sarcosine oxidase delta subunit
MDEREFFEERQETKKHMLVCPHCSQEAEYELNWLVRRKRAQLPRGADESDRAKFAKAQSYMVRRDDMLGCKNVRCRKRFEVVGVQSVAVLQTAGPVPHAADREARLRAAFGRRTLG